jgi:hypothetical protein
MEYLTLDIKEFQVPKIEWNFEDLKHELTLKMEEHNGVIYTEDQLPMAKQELANLRKLLNTLEGARKEVKARCLEPYDAFERDYKELKELINCPIRAIDEQVKDYDLKRKEEKRTAILQMFEDEYPDSPVGIGQLWDDKWLNVSTSLKAVKEEIDARMYSIHAAITMIRQLPEYAFEAEQEYLRTLDSWKALAYVERLKEDAERKKAAKEKKKRDEINLGILEEQETDEPKVWITFKAFVTVAEAKTLGKYCRENGIHIEPIYE